MLGNLPPQALQFVNAPKSAYNKKPLVIEALARQSVPDVSEVLFFIGKPVDGKIPKDAPSVKGRSTDGRKLVWAATLPLKPSMTGTTPISAQFTNAAGLSATITTTVQLTDQDPSNGSIRGTVVEGPRPQVGVDVVLKDAKGQTTAKVKTDANGVFLFEHVKPGQYSTSANKPTSGRRGAAKATVEDGKQSQVAIELWL